MEQITQEYLEENALENDLINYEFIKLKFSMLYSDFFNYKFTRYRNLANKKAVDDDEYYKNVSNIELSLTAIMRFIFFRYTSLNEPIDHNVYSSLEELAKQINEEYNLLHNDRNNKIMLKLTKYMFCIVLLTFLVSLIQLKLIFLP